jgi:hypothetical protein
MVMSRMMSVLTLDVKSRSKVVMAFGVVVQRQMSAVSAVVITLLAVHVRILEHVIMILRR